MYKRRRIGIDPLGRRSLWVVVFLVLQLAAGLGQAVAATAEEVRFSQNTNQVLTIGTVFRDESGRRVSLGDCLGGKPALLVLGYYRCPMICNLLLGSLAESLETLRLSPGKDYSVVCISIDPQETPAVAQQRKETVMRRAARPAVAADWHFLTGQAEEIRLVTSQAGFHYTYDAESKQFSHPAGLVVLTGQGRISRYLLGMRFDPRKLQAALEEAAAGQIGPADTQLGLICGWLGLNPKLSSSIMMGVRVAAGLGVAGLGIVIGYMLRKEQKGHL